MRNIKADHLSDQQVFEITKIIYKEMKARFDQNYVGDKPSLQKFKLEYLQPLYPSKRNMIQSDLDTEQSSDSNQPQKPLPENERNPDFIEKSVSEAQNNDQNSSLQESTEIQKYSFKELCLYLGIGNFICWKSYPPDPVYEDLGLSVCLYLKFMKHLVYTLLILSILPIMQIVFFYSIASSNNYDPASNYQKTLFAMTIGSLSLEGIKCSHIKLSKVDSYTFDLSCPIGKVRVLGPVYSNSKTVSLRACKEDINNLLYSTKLSLKQNDYKYTSDCNGQSQFCTYEVILSQESTQFTDLSVTFQCINGKSKLGGINISRSTALFCSIIFDLLFTVFMVVFYWSQSVAETKEKAYFKSKQLMLNEFTVQVSSFSQNNFEEQFQEFIANLQRLLRDQTGFDKDLQKHIVQVRLPDSPELTEELEKKQKHYEKLYNLIGEFFIDTKRDVSSFTDLNDFINHGFNFDKQFDIYKLKLIKRLKHYTKWQKQEIKTTEKHIKIFIVFSKPKYKRLILECTKTVGRTRYLQFEENGSKKYEVYETLAPALIAWDNMSKTHKIFRNIFSWTITILLIGVTYVLIAFMLWQQNKLLKNYDFSIDCANLFPDEKFASFDKNLAQENINGYTHCYCISKSLFAFINSDPNCGTWAWQYTLYLFIPIIFSIVIVIINVIISIIYRALSKFQAHGYLTSELYSYIVKKSLLLILNMALIIIVLSIDTKQGSSAGQFNFLFQGQYNDITADWYLEVGLFIMLTLIFNLISPIVQSIVFFILTIVTKILISFFKKKPTHLKLKSTYIDFYRGEILPIEERYAFVLAIFTITFCLNFVFPLMTLIFLLTMFFLQLNDKILIIKGYQKPTNFGNQLHSKFIKSLIIILLIHLAITSVLITEPFLLVAGIPTLEGSIKQVNRNRFQAFFETGYVIPYALLFVMVLMSFCVDFAAQIYAKTKPNQRMYIGLDGIPYEQHKFYHLLKKYELKRTLALKKRQIQKLKLVEKIRKSQYIQCAQINLQKNNFKLPSQLDSSSNLQPEELPQTKQKLDSNHSEFILLSIAEQNLKKLQDRMKQNIPDQERIVQLNGMTVYDWQKDWVFFDEHVSPNYEIPGLGQALEQITSLEAVIDSQGKIFNYEA